jgi:serine/threonine protein kinase
MDVGAAAGGVGQMVVGDWVLCNRIGAGSFAVVWKAKHALTGQVVAIKEISTDKLNKKLKQSLESEVSILKQITHKNIVKLLEVIEVYLLDSLLHCVSAIANCPRETIEHLSAVRVTKMQSPTFTGWLIVFQGKGSDTFRSIECKCMVHLFRACQPEKLASHRSENAYTSSWSTALEAT